MARITVEDCLEKIDSQYDLVLLAKERTSQLNAGEKPVVPLNNDKNISNCSLHNNSNCFNTLSTVCLL